MSKLCWVGPRLSDVAALDTIFDRYIVLHGSPVAENVVSKNIEGEQINVNNPQHHNDIADFFYDNIKSLASSSKDYNFLFYGKVPEDVYADFKHLIPYTLSPQITKFLSDKFECRSTLSKLVDVVPTSLLLRRECELSVLKERLGNHTSFIAQRRISAGGAGSYIIDAHSSISAGIPEYETLAVSPRRLNSISVNQHVLICENPVLLPPSVQIIRELDRKFLYSGCDYNAFEDFKKDIKDKVNDFSATISKWLLSIGYKGVVGIDYLILNEGKVEFVEINPRFQSSTFLLNKILTFNGKDSLQELHISAFKGPMKELPKLKLPDGVNYYAPLDSELGRFQLQTLEGNSFTPDLRESFHNVGKMKVSAISDNLLDGANIEKGSMPVKFSFSEKICSISFDGKLNLKPSIEHSFNIKSHRYFSLVSEEDLAYLKFSLLSTGVRISTSAKNSLYQSRNKLTIRDGIAGGVEVKIDGNIHINLPVKESFCLISPFQLEFDDVYYISYYGEFITEVEIVPFPSFVGRKTASGKNMEDVGQIFTDRLSINPFRGCRYNLSNKKGCKFCAVGYGPVSRKMDLADIQEVVTFSVNDPSCNANHILISGGSPTPAQWSYYLDTIGVIRKITSIPLYIMIEPPEKLEQLQELYDAGVDEIGINMELWDDEIALEIMPGKGACSRDTYIQYLKKARQIWTRQGAVRSLLIVGIEPMQNTLKAVEALAKIGVMPILSPFRAVPLTALQEHPTPSAELMYEIWSESRKICQKYQVTLGPSCIACQNNTITLPFGGDYSYY